MRRRKFIILLGGSAVVWALTAAPVLAQTFRPIDDPEKFAADVVHGERRFERRRKDHHRGSRAARFSLRASNRKGFGF